MTRLRLGMVGGGRGAFIGAVHRAAATMDGEAVLVCGAFSSTPERALASGADLGLDPSRVYPTWRRMLDSELARPADDRIDLVSIVTPNDTHFDIARAFVESGVHVVIDKPMVVSIEQADALTRAVETAGTVCAVTYNYSGYPLVRTAARLVRGGNLGDVRKVFVEYHQGWLAAPREQSGHKQAVWRTDPDRAGPAGAVGDIGTHAEHLVSYVTGLEIESLCADLSTFVPGRRVDDDAAVLLRFRGGARGVLTCSQVCVGTENALSIRVYGTKGSVSWCQESPNQLKVARPDGGCECITRGSDAAGPAAADVTRLPPGHPEGFHEAFANIYRAVFADIRARRSGAPRDESADYPTVEDGARGVRFIHRVLASAGAGGAWVDV